MGQPCDDPDTIELQLKSLDWRGTSSANATLLTSSSSRDKGAEGLDDKSPAQIRERASPVLHERAGARKIEDIPDGNGNRDIGLEGYTNPTMLGRKLRKDHPTDDSDANGCHADGHEHEQVEGLKPSQEELAAETIGVGDGEGVFIRRTRDQTTHHDMGEAAASRSSHERVESNGTESDQLRAHAQCRNLEVRLPLVRPRYSFANEPTVNNIVICKAGKFLFNRRSIHD